MAQHVNKNALLKGQAPVRLGISLELRMVFWQWVIPDVLASVFLLVLEVRLVHHLPERQPRQPDHQRHALVQVQWKAKVCRGTADSARISHGPTDCQADWMLVAVALMFAFLQASQMQVHPLRIGRERQPLRHSAGTCPACRLCRRVHQVWLCSEGSGIESWSASIRSNCRNRGNSVGDSTTS